MKCANAQISFAFAAGIAAIAAFVGFTAVAPAMAQVPTAAPITAPVTAPAQNLKEVAPLNVPGAPPLGVAADMGDDEELDIPSGMPKSSAMGSVGAAPAPRMNTMGSGATPEGKNIPSAVTDVVDDLKRAEKNVSLEDVARAQDALARLDLLLDIEKKINDIEKVRDERKSIGKSFSRESGSSGGFGQIPASALSLPMSGGSPFRPATTSNSAPSVTSKPSVTTTPTISAPPRASADGYTVDQITGSNGRYRAVISESGGKKSTVSQGEKLGGFTVSNISATGVTLTNDKDRKVLTVESNGVPMVVRPR